MEFKRQYFTENEQATSKIFLGDDSKSDLYRDRVSRSVQMGSFEGLRFHNYIIITA